MSRRVYVIVVIFAFVLAIILTAVAWTQTLDHKLTPEVPLALWFPLIIITNALGFAAYTLALIQFPLFAVLFAFGTRRWPAGRVFTVLAFTYGLLAGIAFSIV